MDLTAEESTVLDALKAEFPVSWAPYCDVGERLGMTEVDVLNIVLGLRAHGVISRIGATFSESFEPTDPARADLASLVDDIPTGEHPFDEIHEQLEFRGVDVTREWVIETLQQWIADEEIVRFGIV